MIDQETIGLLMKGVNAVTWQSLVMIGVSFVLFYLAIAKDYEPLLLLPIGAGCLLANLPLSPLIGDDGMLKIAVRNGRGQRTVSAAHLHRHRRADRLRAAAGEPEVRAARRGRPVRHLPDADAGAAARLHAAEAASIGIIGAIDGPTSIYVSGILAPHMLGPITVAAYSYMSLVPIILPPVIRLLTTKEERLIRMPYSSRKISRRTRIMFPIIVTSSSARWCPSPRR
jgi:Na+-transporting methylmalonyl-CoA/oxaloacetate decarboxylase beta subunit